MKKSITTLSIFVFLLYSNVFAQYGWGNPTTSGSTNFLTDVHFISDLKGWAVGYGGTVLKTTDGGINWMTMTSGTTNNLFSTFFVSETQGWAVGNSGVIRYTSNGGTSWSSQTSGTGLNLESVFFVSPTQGWAVGSNGTIKASNGSSWWSQTSGTTSWLISVFFISPTKGWAVGNGGTIITTDDGGVNWTPQTSGTTNQLTSVFFASSTHGWITGPTGKIYATTDGGINWALQTTPTTQRLNSIYFTSLLDGIAVGDNGVIIRTNDGGLTWVLEASGTTNSLSSVTIGSPNTGWLVGLNGTIKVYQCITAVPTADSTQSFCSSNAPTIADLVVSGNNVQWYAAATGGSPLATNDPLSPNVYYASQTVGGCESINRMPVIVSIRTTAPSSPAINGTSTVCEGSNQIYTATANKADSYTWILPSGWSGTSTTGSISTTVGSSGTISVTANNACGSSTPNTLNITVNPLPLQPSPINGNTTVCEGSSQPYSFFGEVGVTYNWAFPNGWTQVAGGTTNSSEAIVGSSSGDIVVTPSNSCGNGMYNILTVTVNPLPDVTVNITGNTITANQNAATVYQWLDCNNSFAPISGENNQSFSPTTNGNYAVEVNLNGCIDQSACEVITLTSINENENSTSVVVYPNPNNGTFNIKAENHIGKVEVLNVFGQVVFVENNVTSNQVQVNFNAASGIYFVRLTDVNNIVYKTEKITKQ